MPARVRCCTCWGGLDVPSAGEVYVAGQKMSALSDAARGRLRNKALGFVYQFHHLLPEFTALENVMMPVLLAGRPTAERCSAHRRCWRTSGWAIACNTSPVSCPVASASAPQSPVHWSNTPACVLGDEPTGNLDGRPPRRCLRRCSELNRAQGTSLVLVTHDRRLARRLDRVLEFTAGASSGPSRQATSERTGRDSPTRASTFR